MPSPLIIQVSREDEKRCGHDRCQAPCSEVFDKAEPGQAALRMHRRPHGLKTTARQALENCPEQAIEPDKEETHRL